MGWPAPEPGLVIRYNYLWQREADTGRENAAYARPCTIVIAHHTAAGVTEVVVAPITHSPPGATVRALEIPAQVKRNLGLDDARSWIVADELNTFFWPGVDIEPDANGKIAYGFLPRGLFRQLKQLVVEVAQQGRLTRIPR